MGITYKYSLLCPVLAGGIDGAIIAIIAVKKASTRFQAGTTGFLGGLSLSSLDKGTNFLSKVADKIHLFVDWLLGVISPGGETEVHSQIQDAVVRIVWIAVFVILASLITEWVRASKAENSEAP